jgi:hypothetical protein
MPGRTASMGRLAVQIGALLVGFAMPLFFNPFSASNVESAKIALFLAILLAMLIGWVGPRIAGSVRPQEADALPKRLSIRARLSDLFSANPLAVPALVYALVYLIATLLSVDTRVSWLGPGNGHGTVVTIGLVIFFLLAADAVRTWEEVDRVVTALLIGSVPIALYGLVQYVGLDPLLWRTATVSPVQGTLGLSVFCGAYLVLVMPFTLARAFVRSDNAPTRGWSYVLVFALQCLCLLLTLARGAVLGWVVGIATFCWLMTHRWCRLSRVGAVAALVIVGMLLFALVYRWGVLLFPGHTVSLTELERIRATSNTVRIMLWRTLVGLIPGALPFGYGPETLGTVYQSRGLASAFPEVVSTIPPEPHNIFLYQLLSTGIGGLLAFLWLLLAFCRTTVSTLRRTADRRERALVAALIASVTGYLIQAQFHPDGIASLCLLWLVFALTVATNRLVEDRDSAAAI